jgi:hypothetical protein
VFLSEFSTLELGAAHRPLPKHFLRQMQRWPAEVRAGVCPCVRHPFLPRCCLPSPGGCAYVPAFFAAPSNRPQPPAAASSVSRCCCPVTHTRATCFSGWRAGGVVRHAVPRPRAARRRRGAAQQPCQGRVRVGRPRRSGRPCTWRGSRFGVDLLYRSPFPPHVRWCRPGTVCSA